MKSGSVLLRQPSPRNPRSTNKYVPREAYRVIRAGFARLARKAGRVRYFIFASRACRAHLACLAHNSRTKRTIRGAAPPDRYEGDATDLVDQSRWTARSTTNAAQDGSQIHIASLARIRTPYALKNSLTPIGDTKTGRTGKKYLVVSNGEKNATPNPPFVIASSTPCDAVQRKK